MAVCRMPAVRACVVFPAVSTEPGKFSLSTGRSAAPGQTAWQVVQMRGKDSLRPSARGLSGC